MKYIGKDGIHTGNEASLVQTAIAIDHLTSNLSEIHGMHSMPNAALWFHILPHLLQATTLMAQSICIPRSTNMFLPFAAPHSTWSHLAPPYMMNECKISCPCIWNIWAFKSPCLYQYQFTNSQHLCPHKNMTFTYRTYQTSPWWSATNDWEESTLCHSAIAPNKTHHLLLPTMTLAHLTISTGTQPCYGPSTKPTWHSLMLPSTTKPPPTWQQVCIYSHQPEQTKPTTFLCPPLWHLPKICYKHPNISVKLLKYGS